jgi:hypothetical protein
LVNRTDALSVFLYIALAAVIFLSLQILNPNRLLQSSILGVGTFVLFLYPAIWAFSIRRALAIRLYRNQALGTGLFCVGLLLSTLSTGGSSPNGAGAFTLTLFLLFIFYLIDTSALAGRRSDPLLRDTLRWSRIRLPVWVIVLALIVPELVDMVNTGTYSTWTSDFLGFVVLFGYLLIPGVGLSLQPLVSGRSKDAVLKKHLAWLGIVILATFATPIVGRLLLASLSGGGYAIGLAFAGFFLYKSARSLVPLNRISAQDLQAPPGLVNSGPPPLPIILFLLHSPEVGSRHVFRQFRVPMCLC